MSWDKAQFQFLSYSSVIGNLALQEWIIYFLIYFRLSRWQFIVHGTWCSLFADTNRWYSPPWPFITYWSGLKGRLPLKLWLIIFIWPLIPGLLHYWSIVSTFGYWHFFRCCLLYWQIKMCPLITILGDSVMTYEEAVLRMYWINFLRWTSVWAVSCVEVGHLNFEFYFQFIWKYVFW